MPRAMIALISLGSLSLPFQAAGQSVSEVQQVGTETMAAITHEGSGNNTVISQDGSELDASVTINGADNRQLDGANTITQTGEGSTASVNITGDANEFTVLQQGANGPAQNDAAIDIAGSFNTASISQINDVGTPYGNTAYIQQAGDANQAFINQAVSDPSNAGGDYGFTNNASVTQLGNDNYAKVDQTGTGNSASVNQNGNSNTAEIAQTGVGSSLALTQNTSHNTYSVTQTGCLVSSCEAIEVTQGPAIYTSSGF